jgi:hypothetical protein
VLYFDTSFLMPLVRPERTSGAVSAFFANLRPHDLAVSLWGRVELASGLAREVRAGTLSPGDAGEALTQFDAVVEASFLVLCPDKADFELAVQYLRRFETGLRAGDALHLAIATNRAASAIHTLDKALVRAGAILSLPVKRGIE